MDRYQTALRGEIAAHGERLVRLRDEIASLTVRREALEHALAIYDETRPSSVERRGSLGRAGSQTTFVLNAIRESGAHGLTTVEIYEKLTKAGHSMKKATVRSLLYGRKKDGVLERLPDGRYRVPQSRANGADTGKAGDANLEQGTSPALVDHRTDLPVDHHAQGREAVPGGGT